MKEIKDYIIKKAQFPYGRRKYQYQSIEEENMIGIRDMKHRYKVLKLPQSFRGKRVLDIGCSMGMICVESMKRGAVFSVGLEYNKETVDVAKEYFKIKGYNNIEIVQYNIDNGLDRLISLIGENKFDYVFSLSIWKHVNKSNLYDIINYYCSDKCWFEGHNKQQELFFEKELSKNLKFSQIKFLGYTKDRGKRANFLLTYNRM